MSSDVTCCTCASILNAKPPRYSRDRSSPRPSDEKAAVDEKAATSVSSREPALVEVPKPSRQLPCCNRVVCTSCIAKNARFNSYCPYCQITSAPSPLPQGLRDPPAYNSQPPSPKQPPTQPPGSTPADDSTDERPPAYSSLPSHPHPHPPPSQQQQQQQEDTTHHLRPTDTMQSLSLAYNIPAPILRAHNNLFSDHLLSARHTLTIPATHYSGPSLSPVPVDSAQESERKAGIRRFMVGAKCADYTVAELYLKQSRGDVEAALECWREDERWERENPFDKGKMGRRRNAQGRRRGAAYGGTGSGLTGQLG